MERIRLTGPPGFVVGAQPHAAFRSETGLSERLAADRPRGDHHV
jgi:hypothetical protein